jgi:hypothetical protein
MSKLCPNRNRVGVGLLSKCGVGFVKWLRGTVFLWQTLGHC